MHPTCVHLQGLQRPLYSASNEPVPWKTMDTESGRSQPDNAKCAMHRTCEDATISSIRQATQSNNAEASPANNAALCVSTTNAHMATASEKTTHATGDQSIAGLEIQYIRRQWRRNIGTYRADTLGLAAHRLKKCMRMRATSMHVMCWPSSKYYDIYGTYQVLIKCRISA